MTCTAEVGGCLLWGRLCSGGGVGVWGGGGLWGGNVDR